MFQIRFTSFSVVTLVASILASHPSRLSAQVLPPEVEWERTFAVTDDDYGLSIRQTTDGGYVVAGRTYSFVASAWDAYLIKTDAQGVISHGWPKTFGGVRDDGGYSVQLTTDGGYIVAGFTHSFDIDSYDAYLVKTDSIGNLVWEKAYGGAGSDGAFSVQQTTDGGYIVSGWTSLFGADSSDDVYLIKTDAEGIVAPGWPKSYGSIGQDWGRSVQQTTDGGYIIAGFTYSLGTGSYDAYLLKTDADGNLDQEWLPNPKTFGGVSRDEGSSVQQTADGGYIVAGRTYLGAGDWNAYLLKTNANGIVSPGWPKTFGGIGHDGFSSVQQTKDGGYIVAGSTGSLPPGWSEVYLVKLYPERLPLPPEPPTNLIATYSDLRSVVTLTWQPSPSSVDRYLVERKLGCSEWLILDGSFSASGPTIYEDGGVPNGTAVCYRVSAAVVTLVSAPTEPACLTTPAAGRQQLQILDYRSNLPAWSGYTACSSLFRENRGTVLITHGYTLPPFLPFPCDVAQVKRDWLELATKISQRLSANVNVMFWEWVPESCGLLALVENLNGQAGLLAESLVDLFPPDYPGPLHLMGHSYGCHLAVVCAGFLGQGENHVLVNQITLWDPPEEVGGLGNLAYNVGVLRGRGTYVELYDGCLNTNVHGVDLWVSTPVFLPVLPSCHRVYDWYGTTISGVEEPGLYRVDHGRRVDIGGTVGFGTSALLLGLSRRPQSDLCPEGVSQIYDYHQNPTTLGFDFYQSEHCGEFPGPTLQRTQDLLVGQLDVPDACSGLSSTEVVLCTLTTGDGGGAQVGGTVARYLLPLTIEPEAGYLSFEYVLEQVPATSSLVVRWDSETQSETVFTVSQDRVILGYFVSSGLLHVGRWRGQTGALIFELQSTEPGSVARVRNLGYWGGADDGQAPVRFLRGDSNGDGLVNIADAIQSLAVLFTGAAAARCEDASDANDDGDVDVSDPVFTLLYLFLVTGPEFPLPFPAPGLDPSPDSLRCMSYPDQQ